MDRTSEVERLLVAPVIPSRAAHRRPLTLEVGSVLCGVGDRLDPGQGLARLVGRATVTISTPVRGRVTGVPIRRGDPVEEGTVLASLEVTTVGGRHLALQLREEADMGVTLWPLNGDGSERFDGPVPPASLPVTEGLRTTLERLAFLGSVGWEREITGQGASAPTDADPHAWRELSASEASELSGLRGQLWDGTLVSRLADELGPGYSIVHHTGVLAREELPGISDEYAIPRNDPSPHD